MTLPSLCPCRANHSDRGPVARAPSTSRGEPDRIMPASYPVNLLAMPSLCVDEAPTVRIMDTPDELLAALWQRRGTDLLLLPGAPPLIRVDGDVTPLPDAAPLTREDARQAARALLSDGQL